MSGIIGDNTGRGTGLIKSAGGGGKVLQVVGTSKTDITTTTSNGVWADLGISQAITPTAASSKIMIMGVVDFYMDGFIGFKVVLDVASGGYGDITGAIGDTRGSRTRCFAGKNRTEHDSASLTFLDSPSYSLGNELTYKIQWMTDGSTGRLNYGLADTNNDGYGSNASTFNLMEIGA